MKNWINAVGRKIWDMKMFPESRTKLNKKAKCAINVVNIVLRNSSKHGNQERGRRAKFWQTKYHHSGPKFCNLHPFPVPQTSIYKRSIFSNWWREWHCVKRKAICPDSGLPTWGNPKYIEANACFRGDQIPGVQVYWGQLCHGQVWQDIKGWLSSPSALSWLTSWLTRCLQMRRRRSPPTWWVSTKQSRLWIESKSLL